jgi:hypothetical protein
MPPLGVPKVCWACELRRYAMVSPEAEVLPVIRGQRGEGEFGDRGHRPRSGGWGASAPG